MTDSILFLQAQLNLEALQVKNNFPRSNSEIDEIHNDECFAKKLKVTHES